MSDAEKIQALLDLLADAELLLNTAPITGSAQFVGKDKWTYWTEKRLAWLNQLSKTLIIDMAANQPLDDSTR